MQRIFRKQNEKNSGLGPSKVFLMEISEVSQKINLIYIGSKGTEEYEETGRVVEH